jgi:hypothetical protein
MKTKILAASILLACSSAVIHAQSYQIEGGLSINEYDPDFGRNDTSIGAYGEYHFKRVQTANRPLAEAAFLQKSSNAYVRGYRDLDVIYAGAEFYIPDTMFYIAGEIQRVDVPGSGRNNDWGVRLGLTPIAGLLVWTSYYDEPGYDLNLHAKYVLDLGRNNAINVEAGYIDGDDNNAVYVFGDFYFDRTFSVGAGYSDEYDDDAFTLRTRKFFTNSVSGELAYTAADDYDSFTIGGSMRF